MLNQQEEHRSVLMEMSAVIYKIFVVESTVSMKTSKLVPNNARICTRQEHNVTNS